MVQFPASMGDDARKSVEVDYRRILAEEMIPALRHLGALFGFYLAKVRTTDGFSALPNGKNMYRLAVRYETTTDRTRTRSTARSGRVSEFKQAISLRLRRRALTVN
jgi:uncharacterized protein (DUF885 family)